VTSLALLLIVCRLNIPQVEPDAQKRWLEPDTAYKYGILFEMEYIETLSGVYPSTCGFLRLLHVLFSSGSCPASLGSSYRSRPGCTPYMEYIVSFLLPRATGNFEHSRALPFRSPNEQHKLISLCLSVVETVLGRFTIPTSTPVSISNNGIIPLIPVWFETTRLNACRVLEHVSLAESVCTEPSIDEATQFYADFDDLSNSRAATSDQPCNPPLLPAKSPAFTAFGLLLSHSISEPFTSLMSIVSKGSDLEELAESTDALIAAWSMFGSYPPSFLQANDSQRVGSPFGRPRFLEKMLETGNHASSYSASVRAVELSITRSLRLLCSALARERHMAESGLGTKGQLVFVPVLRFKKTRPGRMQVTTASLNILSVRDRFFATERGVSVLHHLVLRVGTSLPESDCDVNAAAAAVSLLFHLDHAMPGDFIHHYASSGGTIEVVASSFAARILSAANRRSKADLEILDLILTKLLECARSSRANSRSLSHALLAERSYRDNCCRAVVKLTTDISFVELPETAEIASMCYELLFRLCFTCKGDGSAEGFDSGVSKRLRADAFWHKQLPIVSHLSEAEGENSNRLHSLSWLLKGIASELRQLVCLDPPVSGMTLVDQLVEPFVGQAELLRKLFTVLAHPLVKVDLVRFATPSAESLRNARVPLRGSADVVDGYDLVDGAKLLKDMKENFVTLDESSLLEWVRQRNFVAQMACSRDHLSNAVCLVVLTVLASMEHLDRNGSNLIAKPQRIIDALISYFDAGGSSASSAVFSKSSWHLDACLLATTASLSQDLSELDKLSVAGTLADIIVSAGFKSASDPEAIRHNERVVKIGGSLAQLVDARAQIDPFLMRKIAHAALTLFELSPGQSKEGYAVLTPNGAHAARSSVTTLLGVVLPGDAEVPSSNRTGDGLNVLYSGEVHCFVSLLLGQLEALEGCVADVLTAFGRHSSGRNILVDCGVFPSLAKAATLYSAKCNPHSRVASASQLYCDPSYLSGHLTLLSCLLSGLSRRDSSIQLVASVFEILQTYQPILEQAATRFPVDGELLHSFLRCLSLAAGCAEGMTPLAVHTLDQSCDNCLYDVIVRIGINPLPATLLCSFPWYLRNQRYEPQKSWWDDLKIEDSETMISSATEAFDILFCGLFYFWKRGHVNGIDPYLLMRLLVRCDDALKVSIWSLSTYRPRADRFSQLPVVDLPVDPCDAFGRVEKDQPSTREAVRRCARYCVPPRCCAVDCPL
jgi:Nuclear pore complex scaffold, nucleoporins 186/192/205